ncbi:MAG: tRNA (mo5U34)-methyltransferase [Arenicella sp.]
MGAESSIRISFGNQMSDQIVFNFETFLARPEFSACRNHFEEVLNQRVKPGRHGDLPQWLSLLKQLPSVTPSSTNIDCDTIQIGNADDLTVDQRSLMHQTLLDLSPWRKGPFDFFGAFIDTEWRSDWKWQRLAPHIASLAGRRVLDVGCGTGYHGWRMLGAGADYVLGIDPSMRFLIQYLAAQKYLNDSRFDFLPIGIEDMPDDLKTFDTVFSMGVLYHRRNPINHLLELKQLLNADGELVLETLIVDQADDGILRPEQRYAKMRNVWSVMTTQKIELLLGEAGFVDIRCVDQNVTGLDEQRTTDWMQFHSLKQFLDPDNFDKTIEGYPAPKRGIFIARKAIK